MKGLLLWILAFAMTDVTQAQDHFKLTKDNYLASSTGSILVFSDQYSEGHQGGIQIILHGERLAANGDLWLDPVPGQWDPFSQLNTIDRDSITNSIRVSLSFPNQHAAERTFNRISYPGLELNYSIEVIPEGEAVRIVVNLDKILPKDWLGKVGFNLELFPGAFFDKHYYMDGHPGVFPRQLNSPFLTGDKTLVTPMATGKELVIAPGDALSHIKIESLGSPLQLLDGRARHNNGWFVVRSLVTKGTKDRAIEWLVTPYPDSSWQYGPVIHHNQVGYLPGQAKSALIESDPGMLDAPFIELIRIDPEGNKELILADTGSFWGRYQRYNYYQFDFSRVTNPGIYYLRTGDARSESFSIAEDCYDRGVWQPTLEYFLPVQMCHMKVRDRYRIWHGLCHMDDARMAPDDTVHFDGYQQEESNYTHYEPDQTVPGLNKGGWHDAGDYDLRVESQGNTIYTLSLIYENFGPQHDMTTVDQAKHLVEMQQPDGVPDMLQQIEHGTLSIVSAHKALGRLYRGIICRNLRQYVLLGDGSTMTDNISYGNHADLPQWLVNENDDRWVFTEENPRRELQVCSHLAAASRVLKDHNKDLSADALSIAIGLWQNNTGSDHNNEKVIALTELYLTTQDTNYLQELIGMSDYIARHVAETGWALTRVKDDIKDMRFQHGYRLGIAEYYRKLQDEAGNNPFGLPYHPRVWGSAWGIEWFGMQQYFYHKYLQLNEASGYLQRSLDYLLGYHSGSNTSSFVSGVGTRSATVAYGLNRADWSYIPGGVISGTAVIQPDFPELKEWPYLWQQTEYMVSGAASGFMFLVLGMLEMELE
ncbi:MAG: glycoside hydrolase family 9 protein [Bacteroidales bacterium]|nr:glycoside hydrolase family 9 protein [Bacteroidales bacterium]